MTDFDKIHTIIPEFVTGARYFVPTDNTLGNSWTGLADPPNIAQWGTGQTGIGFEATPEEFRDLIKTSVGLRLPAQMHVHLGSDSVPFGKPWPRSPT